MTDSFFIFGAGYSGLAIARSLRRHFGENARIYGTSRHIERTALLSKAGITPLLYDGHNFASAAEEEQARAALAAARFCFVSIPPALSRGQTEFNPAPASDFAQEHLNAAESLIYLSTIGVYGDTQGAWIDETAPLKAVSPHNIARQKAEALWAEQAQARGIKALTLRLGGIYGGNLTPRGFSAAAKGSYDVSRSPFARIAAGQARAVIKPGQVFNRIHVKDIGEAACHLALNQCRGVFNLTDGAPCPPQDFLNFAAALPGKAPLPQTDFAQAEMSAQNRAFYQNNRRISNAKLTASGYRLLYPDYKTGLTKIYQSRNW